MSTPFVLVIDDSVFCHLLHSCLDGFEYTDENYSRAIQAQVVWLQSGVWLPPEYINRPFKTISVYDSKPYWRTEYLTRPEVVSKVPRKNKQLRAKCTRLEELLSMSKGIGGCAINLITEQANQAELEILTEQLAISYKGGRKFPDYSFTKMKKYVHRLTQDMGYAWLGVPGYEADDLAALACKVLNSRGTNVLLLTVDTDWLGLLSHSVSWYCMKGYTPRLRTLVKDELGVSTFDHWSYKKFGVTFSDPAELWHYKARVGDKSDNLPAGSPIEVIDLYNPPKKHQLWNDKFYYEQLLIEVNRGSSRPSIESANAARTYLQRLGQPVAIQGYNPNSMVNVEHT